MVSGADYTGDGRHDVVAVRDGVLRIHPGDGEGRLSGPVVTVGSGWGGIRHLIGGDFNRDGRGDLVVIDEAGMGWFYPGGVGSFGARSSIGGGWGFDAMTGGVDYNGDGRYDLLARTYGGDLLLYPGDGAGGFGAAVPFGQGYGSYTGLE